MTFEAARDYLLVTSNQYYVGLTNIEVNDDVLQGLITRALKKYSEYNPTIKRIRVQLQFNKNKFDIIEERNVIGIRNIFYINPPELMDYEPVSFQWEYYENSKTLWVAIPGSYVVEFLLEKTLEDISTSDTEFINLLTGLYIMYVASVRKGFGLQDLPFENDGPELFEFGKELYDKALESLQGSHSDWYLAVIP